MLSTDVRPELMIKRIKQVVSILMKERPLFKEELNYSEIVQHLTRLFEENLPYEQRSMKCNQHCCAHLNLKSMVSVSAIYLQIATMQ